MLKLRIRNWHHGSTQYYHYTYVYVRDKAHIVFQEYVLLPQSEAYCHPSERFYRKLKNNAQT